MDVKLRGHGHTTWASYYFEIRRRMDGIFELGLGQVRILEVIRDVTFVMYTKRHHPALTRDTLIMAGEWPSYRELHDRWACVLSNIEELRSRCN